MKMIIAVLRDQDSEPVSQALIAAGLRVTRVASTGGFLHRGSTTLIVGVSDDQVDQAVQVIRSSVSPPAEPGVKRATLFILHVEDFTQL